MLRGESLLRKTRDVIKGVPNVYILKILIKILYYLSVLLKSSNYNLVVKYLRAKNENRCIQGA